MHAMVCLTLDVQILQSGSRCFSSLGVAAQNTLLTARKRLFRAAGAFDAERPTLHCSRKACNRRPKRPSACHQYDSPTRQIADELCWAMRCLSVCDNPESSRPKGLLDTVCVLAGDV